MLILFIARGGFLAEKGLNCGVIYKALFVSALWLSCGLLHSIWMLIRDELNCKRLSFAV